MATSLILTTILQDRKSANWPLEGRSRTQTLVARNKLRLQDCCWINKPGSWSQERHSLSTACMLCPLRSSTPFQALLRVLAQAPSSPVLALTVLSKWRRCCSWLFIPQMFVLFGYVVFRRLRIIWAALLLLHRPRSVVLACYQVSLYSTSFSGCGVPGVLFLSKIEKWERSHDDYAYHYIQNSLLSLIMGVLYWGNC